MKQTIELRQLRDFGQVITDTFTFFKENLKPLIRSLIIICGTFMLISIVTSIGVYMNMATVFRLGPFNNNYDYESHNASYYLSAFINGLITYLLQLSIQLVTLCYISVYLHNNKAEPSLAQVWGYFKYYFWRIFGASILLTMLSILGALFCFLPGIYLGVVFSLVMPIIVIENASFGYAFNKCFRLIRDNWWFVFGVVAVVWIILIIANAIASLPLSFITVLNKMVTVKNLTLPLIIFFSILQHVLMLSYNLMYTAISLCYFDLTEQKDGTGILERIENFGKKPDDTHIPGLSAEEY
jgi:hypothetical protein